MSSEAVLVLPQPQLQQVLDQGRVSATDRGVFRRVGVQLAHACGEVLLLVSGQDQ